MDRLARRRKCTSASGDTSSLVNLQRAVPSSVCCLVSSAVRSRCGTPAQDADLVIEHSVIVVECTRCGARTEAKPNRLICGDCGDYKTRLVSGEEMTLLSLELDLERAPPNSGGDPGGRSAGATTWAPLSPTVPESAAASFRLRGWATKAWLGPTRATTLGATLGVTAGSSSLGRASQGRSW